MSELSDRLRACHAHAVKYDLPEAADPISIWTQTADELDAKDAIIAELVEALTKIADATDSDSLLKLLYRTRSALSKASQD